MDFYEVLDARHSIRKYTNEPVEDDVLERLANAVYVAPSACNRQPYRFLAVRKPALKNAICDKCQQAFLEEAPVLLIAIGDTAKGWVRAQDKFASLDVDVAIAFEHVVLAAAAEGLGTCWVGSFDAQALGAVLKLAPTERVIALSPLGYPAESGNFVRTKAAGDLFQVID